jgi:hypothetical protein
MSGAVKLDAALKDATELLVIFSIAEMEARPTRLADAVLPTTPVEISVEIEVKEDSALWLVFAVADCEAMEISEATARLDVAAEAEMLDRPARLAIAAWATTSESLKVELADIVIDAA